ncbi:MAG: hydroxyethylthiazole kinase [Cloacibacillus sp.]
MAKPLIYQITNTVSAQMQADCTALLGGLSIMSRNIREAKQIAEASDALLINIGTPPENALELYCEAASGASSKGRPMALDLVGFGFSDFRTHAAKELLSQFKFSVVKGNHAEIAALCGRAAAPRGVSCDGAEKEMAAVTKECAAHLGCVVFATGAQDFVSDGARDFIIGGGSALMNRTSGFGCALGSAAALFCANQRPLDASRRALRLFRGAAHKAERTAKGAYSFRINFMDMLAELSDAKERTKNGR